MKVNSISLLIEDFDGVDIEKLYFGILEFRKERFLNDFIRPYFNEWCKQVGFNENQMLFALSLFVESVLVSFIENKMVLIKGV